MRVERRNGDYVLVIPSAIVGLGYESVRPFAEQHLQLLNGIGRLLRPDFKPVTLGSSFKGVTASGAPVQTVVSVETAEERSKAGVIRAVIGGKLQPDPRESAGAPYLRAAADSARVRHVLSLLGSPRLTWSELFLLFELLQTEVGGAMYSAGWITKADADRFTRTANSFSALGLAGRHGKDKDKTSPPPHPMAQAEAQALIRELAGKWLASPAAGLPQQAG